MKNIRKAMAAVLSAAVLLTGCGNDSAATNRELNEMKVEKYVDLGDYTNISVSVAPRQEISQEDCDELLLAVYISNITKDNGGITNRAVEEGDTVIIDYVGTKDGEAFAGGTASDAELIIGSGQFIPGFEEGLKGVMPGETVKLDLTFPESYRNTELAGQPVVFTVTVNYILPSLEQMEDRVVSAFGIDGIGTVEGLRRYVYNYLEESVESAYLYSVQNAVMQQLMQMSTVDELPQTLVDSYNHLYYDNLESMAASYGVTAEVLANANGMDVETYVGLNSEVQARQEILLQAIANNEGLTVSDAELQEALEGYAAENGYETVEEWLGEYDREEYRNYIMCDKVMEFLVGNADVTETTE